MTRYRVTQEVVATRPQGCQLHCGMEIRVGEKIISLYGVGWVHRRDVILENGEAIVDDVAHDAAASALVASLDRTTGDVPAALVEAEDDVNVITEHLFIVYGVPGVVDVRRQTVNERLADTTMYFVRLHQLDVTTYQQPSPRGDRSMTLLFGHLRCAPRSFDVGRTCAAIVAGLTTPASDIQVHLVHLYVVTEEHA